MRRPQLRSIELCEVSVRRGTHWALRDVSLTLRSGEHWLLTGRNGSGKTMLMKLLRGDVWPTPTGREQRLYRLDDETHRQPLAARERIAYLGPESQDKFERYEWNLRVADIVATGLSDSDLPLERRTRTQTATVMRALGDVRLRSLARRRFLTLSNGQRRRVLLARLLVRRPDLLLLDEVLNGLDARARKGFVAMLERIASPRIAWMLSTHRPLEAPRNVTHRAHLDAGRLVTAAAGATRALVVRERPARDARSGIRGSSPTRARARTRSHVARGPLVELRRVSVFRDYRPVLQHLDWTLERGDHWAISGANGSGKSTLIALLYGDLSPAHGGGVVRAGLARGQPIELWKQRVGLVSPELQATYAATSCTVGDLVVSGLHASIGLNHAATRAERRRALQVARQFALQDLLERGPRELSYGQLRAALFARAFMLPRDLLLLDEPFDGLDAQVRAAIESRLQTLVAAGTQVVITTHHRDDVPAYVTRELDLSARVISRR